MKIAIIGAGVAGLTAGRELANGGHEVVVFEKSKGYGGRLSTRYAGKENATRLDHGLPYIELSSEKFTPFVKELGDRGVIEPWVGPFVYHNVEDGKTKELRPSKKRFIAPKGMNEVGRFLARYVDVRTETKVGGLTHIGQDRTKKKTWMLNFTSSAVESADAVIIATPSKQAYAVLNTTIDEIATLKLVREIDEVEYNPSFSFMVGYGDAGTPDWAMLETDHPVISSITNEKIKRGSEQETSFVIHTTAEFSKDHENEKRDVVEEKILDALSEVLGGWAAVPNWKQLHFWRYSTVINPLPYPFMEVVGNDTPIAVIGGYMNGSSLEAAYLSGKAIGEYWNRKFKD